jgi:flavin reductase (DIM6/NTAB) family NADH-FMN oxidoreductase RutF
MGKEARKGGNPMKDVDYQAVAPTVMKRIEDGAFLVVQARDRINIMTIGWAMFGYVWQRPIMMVAVRKSRFTFGIIEEADSFTVSVPTGNMEKEVDICGTKSGRNLDKFRECSLSTVKARTVDSPVLDIPGYHYECRIIYKGAMDPRFLSKDLERLYPMKDHHTLYFGEILSCYLRE